MLKARLAARLRAVRASEDGMEAAQVILILILVVVGLIPVIAVIRNSLSSRASSVNSGVLGTN